jgi:threonine dehydrogenase-like Zn-dependent dehydrogenase
VKELISLQPGSVIWRDYDDPPLSAGQVRLKSLLTAVKHGTEVGLVRRTDPTLRKKYDPKLAVFHDFPPEGRPQDRPLAVGNMTVGRVTEVADGVGSFQPGDIVYGWLGIRETHICAEHQLWKLPAGVGDRDIVCLDPAEYALCGVRDSAFGIGDRVAVFGLGAIGLMAVQLLRLGGAAEIIAVDPLEGRRELALTLGATSALDPSQGDVGLAIKEQTAGGVDIALETSGNTRGLNAAVRATCFGGTITTVGLYSGEAKGLELAFEWHFNRQTLIASRSASEPNRHYPRWDRTRLRTTLIELFRRGQLTSERIIKPIVSFAEAREAYTRILKNPAAGIKLAVVYDD